MLFFSAVPVLPIISSAGPLLITKKLFFGLSKWGDKLLLTSKITTFPVVLLSKLQKPFPSNAILQPLQVNVLLSAFLVN